MLLWNAVLVCRAPVVCRAAVMRRLLWHAVLLRCPMLVCRAPVICQDGLPCRCELLICRTGVDASFLEHICSESLIFEEMKKHS